MNEWYFNWIYVFTVTEPDDGDFAALIGGKDFFLMILTAMRQRTYFKSSAVHLSCLKSQSYHSNTDYESDLIMTAVF